MLCGDKYIHVIRDIVLIPARCGHRPWDIMKHYETIQQSHDAPPALVIKMWRPCLHQGHLHMQLWESILLSFFPICFWLRFPGPRGLPGPPAPALGLDQYANLHEQTIAKTPNVENSATACDILGRLSARWRVPTNGFSKAFRFSGSVCIKLGAHKAFCRRFGTMPHRSLSTICRICLSQECEPDSDLEIWGSVGTFFFSHFHPSGP